MERDISEILKELEKLGYMSYFLSNHVLLLVYVDRSIQSKEKSEQEKSTKPEASQRVAKEEIIKSLSEEEVELLWKVSMIYYKDRNIQNLSKNLNENEMKLLRGLIDKNYVKLLPNGKISFPEQMYEEMKKISQRKTLLAKDLEYGVLSTEDFEVFQKRDDIEDFIVLMNVVDGKIYVIRKRLMQNNKEKILRAIKTPMHVDDISKKLGLPSMMVKIILVILADAGECIEESTNTYRRI
ncbi:MAG: hypothetical protein NZ908_01620 [Candidatus Micrarchaeota archaeon]|nr:hypothetical protein [Candidatus Micrarchaeota archaeon]MCX8154589.1 hypothetical protein [Candidatus Micrarchaeota archaeon]